MAGGASVSGSAFEGLPRTEQSGESYEAAAGFDSSLVTDVVQPYLDGALERRLRKDYGDERAAYTAELADLIERRTDAERFSADAFLAQAVTRLTLAAERETASGAMGMYYPNALLDHLVQALYSLGHNGFHLDMEGLHEQVPTPMVIANCLRGTEERPLETAYHGDAHSAGCQASNCLIDFHGKGRFIGSEARSSTFILHGSMEVIGWGAEDCTFVVPDAAMLFSACRFHHRDTGREADEGTMLRGCSFYVDDADESPGSDVVRALQNAWIAGPAPLFLYGNRLFVRDADGEGNNRWKEVTLL